MDMSSNIFPNFIYLFYNKIILNYYFTKFRESYNFNGSFKIYLGNFKII